MSQALLGVVMLRISDRDRDTQWLEFDQDGQGVRVEWKQGTRYALLPAEIAAQLIKRRLARPMTESEVRCTSASASAIVKYDSPEPRCGKWEKSEIPKHGWVCVGVEDLGPNGEAPCAMCEAEFTRYTLAMTHPNYAATLACGVRCAGAMSGDPAGMRARVLDLRIARKHAQDEARSFAAAKASWGEPWERSAKDNEYRYFRGFVCVVYKRGCAGFGVMIEHPKSQQKAHSDPTYRTVAEAKTALWNAMTKARTLWRTEEVEK